jgi:hypothetical protein
MGEDAVREQVIKNKAECLLCFLLIAHTKWIWGRGGEGWGCQLRCDRLRVSFLPTKGGRKVDFSVFRYRFNLPVVSADTIGRFQAPVFVSGDCIGLV